MPDETRVSIGQAKRDISQLVNRVASTGERILVTVRGEPVAALVSMADYEWLVRAKDSSDKAWRD